MGAEGGFVRVSMSYVPADQAAGNGALLEAAGGRAAQKKRQKWVAQVLQRGAGLTAVCPGLSMRRAGWLQGPIGGPCCNQARALPCYAHPAQHLAQPTRLPASQLDPQARPAAAQDRGGGGAGLCRLPAVGHAQGQEEGRAAQGGGREEEVRGGWSRMGAGHNLHPAVLLWGPGGGATGALKQRAESGPFGTSWGLARAAAHRMGTPADWTSVIGVPTWPARGCWTTCMQRACLTCVQDSTRRRLFFLCFRRTIRGPARFWPSNSGSCCDARGQRCMCAAEPSVRYLPAFCLGAFAGGRPVET